MWSFVIVYVIWCLMGLVVDLAEGFSKEGLRWYGIGLVVLTILFLATYVDLTLAVVLLVVVIAARHMWSSFSGVYRSAVAMMVEKGY